MNKKSASPQPGWKASRKKETVSARPAWTFLTNHAHVLLCIYREPEIRLRDVALRVGITERMVQKIVADLAEAGYLVVEKNGRCNRYQLQIDLRLRHPLQSHHSVGRLLKLLRLDS